MQDEKEDIDWDQCLQPEEAQNSPGILSLSKRREIEVRVSVLENVQEGHLLRKKLRNKAMKLLELSDAPELLTLMLYIYIYIYGN
jgi:hypothetical protein